MMDVYPINFIKNYIEFNFCQEYQILSNEKVGELYCNIIKCIVL